LFVEILSHDEFTAYFRMSLIVAVHDLEASVCREKENVHEMQELLNQEQQWRLELHNRIELQSQSSVGLEEQRDHLQKLSSDQENQLRQFVYV
jgi:hypothetical protein